MKPNTNDSNKHKTKHKGTKCLNPIDVRSM